jgi:hypothetical protein
LGNGFLDFGSEIVPCCQKISSSDKLETSTRVTGYDSQQQLTDLRVLGSSYSKLEEDLAVQGDVSSCFEQVCLFLRSNEVEDESFAQGSLLHNQNKGRSQDKLSIYTGFRECFVYKSHNKRYVASILDNSQENFFDVFVFLNR